MYPPAHAHPPPPTPSSPPPASPPTSPIAVVDRLNRRFVAGRASDDLHDAGVLVHTFDDDAHIDDDEGGAAGGDGTPWLPSTTRWHGAGADGFVLDRVSAQSPTRCSNPSAFSAQC